MIFLKTEENKKTQNEIPLKATNTLEFFNKIFDFLVVKKKGNKS